MRYTDTAIPSATAAAQDFPTQKHFVMATAPIILAAGLAALAPDWTSEPLPHAFPAQNAETATPISAAPSIPRTVRAFGQACNTAKFQTFADD
jgi:cytochrome c5